MNDPHDVPAVFRDALAGLDEQRYVTGADHPFYACFGCGPGHPDGLRVRCFKAREGVVAPIVISERYQGPKGLAAMSTPRVASPS